MLPRMSGLDVCKQLCRQGSELPIIMLTARGQEIDKVLGLKGGADDYVTKPFSFMELLARVEAVLGHTSHLGVESSSADCYQFGDVFLDFKKLSHKSRQAARPDLTRIQNPEIFHGPPRRVGHARSTARSNFYQPATTFTLNHTTRRPEWVKLGTPVKICFEKQAAIFILNLLPFSAPRH